MDRTITLNQTLSTWLSLPDISFSRDSRVSAERITCDCSGLINLLFDALQIPKPYQIERPKALHYFAVLQEMGSDHIDALDAGSLLAWRKEQVPQSGDTGHVLIVMGPPVLVSPQLYLVPVVDATKLNNGLARREIEVQTDNLGKLVGVRLHLSESKFKRTAMYHQSLIGSRFCFGCALPVRACHCGTITPILEVPPVVILRHPKERKRTLSTVSLIKQRYPSVLVKEGEVFSPLRGSNFALLFPGEEQGGIQANSGQNTTLILIDATWRKAQKILHLNPWLQVLPRVTLKPEKISDYRLRKVAGPEALSSVEAFACVMHDSSLGAMFSQFMDQQIALMGEATYQKNYRHYINFVGDEEDDDRGVES